MLALHRDQPLTRKQPFELRVGMRLARLLDGMANKLVVNSSAERIHPRRGRAMVMKIRFKLPSVGTKHPIVMLTPVRHEIHRPAHRSHLPPRRQQPRLNPMLRALAWQRTLTADSTLSRVSLAKMEKVTPGTITHHCKLMNLHPTIQIHLTNLKTTDGLRRFSLNKMKALAELPADEQVLKFERLGVLDFRQGN